VNISDKTKSSYFCCSKEFFDNNSYLKHIQFHKENSSLQVKCNYCGHSSKSWNAFKRHIKSDHTQISNIDLIFQKSDEKILNPSKIEDSFSSTLIEENYEDNVEIDALIQANSDSSTNN
jgi:hypothetical protein